MNNAPTLPDNMQYMTDLVLTLLQKLDHQSLFIEQLLEQIKLAEHHRFGVKSEAILPDHCDCYSTRYRLQNPVSMIKQKILLNQPRKNPLPKPSADAAHYQRTYPVSRSSTYSMMSVASASIATSEWCH